MPWDSSRLGHIVSLLLFNKDIFDIDLAQSAGAAEYTNCISTEG